MLNKKSLPPFIPKASKNTKKKQKTDRHTNKPNIEILKDIFILYFLFAG